MSPLAHLAAVAFCGGIGCALRVLARDALVRRGTHPWWSTCAVNLSGAMTIGLVAGSASGASPPLGPLTLAAATGLLAGWTTYSAFSMDVVQLWLRGARGHAIGLWAATIAGAPAAALAGGAIARAALGGAA